MYPMNPIFTTHSSADAGSFETQSKPRKAGHAGEQNSENDEFCPHYSAFGARKAYLPAPTSGVWNVGPMHLSPHRVNTMDSLCDLCASSEAGGE